jgi:nucleotide-binding universal stress UspA family protein
MRKAMKILLAVDGSECSFAAVEETARTPWPEGSVVRIISVAELSLPPALGAIPAADGSYEELERLIEERAVANTAQARARFGKLAGAQTDVTTKTLRGDPKVEILGEAEDWGADLIILGTHGYNALERLWLGSVSRAVVSNATCSVMIVRRRESGGMQGEAVKIALAVDGSASSDAAVAEIADRPWPRGTEVHIVSVIQLPFTPTAETWALPESYYSQQEKVGRELAESAVTRAFSRLRESDSEREVPLKLATEIIVGHPETTIIERAKTWGADLVVLGSEGHRGLKRFLLGSVSQAVAYHAPCSVEIVRQPAQSE